MTPQEAYDLQKAREKAKTQGHAARRSIDAANRKAGRKEARKEISERKQFEGTIPIWGAKDPDSGQHIFRPGAKKGWWEDRPNDWIGTQRGAAEGQAGWTKVDPAATARRPGGFGFIGTKVLGGVGGLLNRSGAQAQAAGAGQPAVVAPPKPSSGTPPQPQQQGPIHMWPTIKPNSGLPGPSPAPSPGLPSGQQALPPPGGAVRRPGQSRVLTGQRPRGALGTGSPAIGRGPVIDTTGRSMPSNSGGKKLKGGTGTYMENEYGDEGDEGDHMAWARAAEKRIAFAVDPANKIPKVDSRTAGSSRNAQQQTRYNAAWAKTGTDMPSVYGDERLKY